jgi:predicted nucleotidyltransferase
LPAWPEFRLSALLRALDGLDYVVVGGIAAVAHGSPQVTQDLDIAYAADEPNLERLGQVLKGLGATVRTDALRPTHALTLGTREGRLELLPEPAGSGGYEHLRANAITATVGGVDVRIAGLEDLIAMKKAAGRPKDRIYVEELEAIRRLRAG